MRRPGGRSGRLTNWPGEVIDRSVGLRLSFDGASLIAHPGDTLASALWANGLARVDLGAMFPASEVAARVAHPLAAPQSRGGGPIMPGPVAADGDGETTPAPGALLTADRFDRGGRYWVSGEADVAVAARLAWDGAELRSAAGEPGPAGDAAVLQPPRRSVDTFLRLGDRRALPRGPLAAGFRSEGLAGGGPSQWSADVVVIGAGPGGLGAAHGAAEAGARVILLEAAPFLGGRAASEWSLDARTELLYPLIAQVVGHPNIRALTGVTVWECDPTGRVIALVGPGQVPGAPGPSTSGMSDGPAMLTIQTAGLVLATGSIAEPLRFPGDHLAGVVSAGAVSRLVNLWAVRPGQRAVVVATKGPTEPGAEHEPGQSAAPVEATVDLLTEAGVEVVCCARVGPDGAGLAAHGPAGGAPGFGEVEQVFLPDGRRLEADLLVTVVGRSIPSALLWAAGGAVSIGSDRSTVTVTAGNSRVTLVGSLAGRSTVPGSLGVVTVGDIAAAVATAQAAGRTAAQRAGRLPGRARLTPPPAPVELTGLVAPFERRVVGLPGPTLGALAALARPLLRRSPLAATHEALGGLLVRFGDWLDVLDYGDPESEREALEQAAGVSELARCGLWQVSGPQATDLLDVVVARPGSSWEQLPVGDTAVVAVRPDQGLAGLARCGHHDWELCVGPDLVDAVRFRLAELAGCDHPDWKVHATEVSEAWCRVALRGPAASALADDALRTLVAVPATDAATDAGDNSHRLPLGSRRHWEAGGDGQVEVIGWSWPAHPESRPPSAAPDRFGRAVDLAVPAGQARLLWRALMTAARSHRARPVGFTAFGPEPFATRPDSDPDPAHRPGPAATADAIVGTEKVVDHG